MSQTEYQPGTAPAAAVDPEGGCPARRETFLVVGLLALFLAVNLATATRFPIVWLDEAQHTDPAANLLLGHGFTSSAWYVQGRNEFWAGTVPLHHLLLYGWLRCFGFGPVAVRSLNYACMAVSALCLWLAVRRLRLITTPGARLGFLAVVLLSYGLGICYRSGRYDDVTILLAALTALAFSIPRAGLRSLVLLALGFLFPIAGLQLAAFAFLICGLLLPFTGGRTLRDSVVLGAGILLGFAGLHAFYSSHGVWGAFVAMTRYSRTMVSGSLPRDPSFFLLGLAGAALALDTLCRGEWRWRSPLAFGLAAAAWVPLGMRIIGRFPTYYTWMAIIPLATGLCAGWPEMSWSPRRVWLWGAALAVAAASLAGLPLQLASAVFFWHERDYARVEEFVARTVKPGDWVFCDPAAYYAAKKRAAVVLLPTYYAMTPAERDRVSVFITEARYADRVKEDLKGGWVRLPEEVTPGPRRFLGLAPRADNKLLQNYDLQAWRRKAD